MSDYREMFYPNKKPDYLRQQELDFALHADNFLNIAAQVLRWVNLPPFLRSGYIERILYTQGAICFFKTDVKREGVYGFMALPLARAGQLNVYSEMTDYHMYTPLGISFDRTIDDAVLIRNNELLIPTQDFIYPRIADLVDIRAAMRVNRAASCKTPITITTSDKKQLSSLNFIEQVLGNKPAVLIDQALEGQLSRAQYPNLPPYWGRELREEYNNVLSEILTYIGVLSNPVVKAERVNTLESTSNRGLIIDSIDARLAYRKKACEQINEMFGDELAAVSGGALDVEVNNEYVKAMLEAGVYLDEGIDAEKETPDNGND